MVKPLDRDVRFGRRLKQRRNDAGLKQVDLVSRLNRPQAYVSKYESGKRRLYFFEFVEIVGRILRELIELAERAADAELVDALHDALDVAMPASSNGRCE